MNMRDALLQEFDLERPLTRRCLERVPEGKNDWKPHEKSMTLGWLAVEVKHVVHHAALLSRDHGA